MALPVSSNQDIDAVIEVRKYHWANNWYPRKPIRRGGLEYTRALEILFGFSSKAKGFEFYNRTGTIRERKFRAVRRF
jgi:hypothetical protein